MALRAAAALIISHLVASVASFAPPTQLRGVATALSYMQGGYNYYDPEFDMPPPPPPPYQDDAWMMPPEDEMYFNDMGYVEDHYPYQGGGAGGVPMETSLMPDYSDYTSPGRSFFRNSSSRRKDDWERMKRGANMRSTVDPNYRSLY